MHMRIVFELLHAHRMYLKKSKCSFGKIQVAYLGHVVSGTSVKVNKRKLKAIMDLPQPNFITTLQGFLGLTGYYCKSIQAYGQLAIPLTSMLKRNSFRWTDATMASFQTLKQALTSATVLQLPNFVEEFIIECDASRGGIGAVLQQNSHLIAFFSRQLAVRHHKLAVYERKLIGVVKAVQHWRPYLWASHF